MGMRRGRRLNYLMKPVTVDEAISSNFKHRKAIQIPRQKQRYIHF